MAMVYGTGSDSSVGGQIRTDYFYKKALVEVAKEAYFGQMADSMTMPKNMGKTIKLYHYLPILDDRNMNDQGINATNVGNGTQFDYPIGQSGANSTTKTAYVRVVKPENVDQTASPRVPKDNSEGTWMYFRGDHASNGTTALQIAKGKAASWLLGQKNSLSGTTVSNSYTALTGIDTVIDNGTTAAELATIYGILSTTGAGLTPAGVTPLDEGYLFTEYAATENTNYGNLYGSSKDVGTISGKIPTLTESGGRVNRVGMKRLELEGTLDKFGFFTEYTQDSLDFDSDTELLSHLTTEVIKAANEMTEDQHQVDLLNSAGVIRYTGSATSPGTLQGNDVADPFGSTNTNDAITYDDLVKLSIELDNNRVPKATKIISGSRMVDTKVVNAARYIYIGSELIPSIMKMTDYHGNKAFIPVAQYASAGTVAKGEFGAVDNFRFIVVPEMMHWAATGATVTSDTTLYRNSADSSGVLKYDVFPMLVVGDGAFTTVGFQTDGKSVKFKTKHVRPEQNYSNADPYGTKGFYSVQWWYGFMPLRSERIAVVKTIAEWG